MNWLLIGTLLGSIVTSGHDTREACEGRATLLREKGASVQCHNQRPSISTSATGGWSCGTGQPCWQVPAQ